MKKFLTLFIAAGIFSLVACGPAAEEATQAEEISNEATIETLEATEEEATEEVAEETVETEEATEQAN